MGGTRSSTPVDPSACERVVRAVAASLAALERNDGRIVVALSGGRDSVALLDALSRSPVVPSSRLLAAHVHHGLSVHADAWQHFCERLTASRGIELVTRRVHVATHDASGIESAARNARYAALNDIARAVAAAAIMTAHHQDDQAETLLLQLLRGAGPHGLASMPGRRRDAGGRLVLRPLIDVPRRAIDAYVAARALAYVDDDSNASERHRRNALRTKVLPAIADIAPPYARTLARAARHQAEAAQLLDELAAIDAMSLVVGGELDSRGLVSLGRERGRNLLRWFLRQRGLRAPSARCLTEMLGQLAGARADARVRFVLDGGAISLYRGRVVVHRPPPTDYVASWRGEPFVQLPHGRLAFVRGTGHGVSATRIANLPIHVRPRRGGERLQIDAARPRRALKALLQEASLAPWRREALPLVYCNDRFIAAPGLGVDVAFQSAAGEPSFVLDWQPDERPDR